jgi:hypothetical protein
MEKQNDIFKQYKENFNIVYFICLVLQRCIVAPLRTGWGTDALGVPCLFAFVLMVLWSAFSRDPFMYAWLACWSVCHLFRRAESLWLYATAARLHGWYDGRPYCVIVSEDVTKLFVEPLLVGGLDWVAFWYYDRNQFAPYGLPYFLLTGVFTLPFVEIVKRTIWQRRTQATLNARLDQQATMQDFRRKYGDF